MLQGCGVRCCDREPEALRIPRMCLSLYLGIKESFLDEGTFKSSEAGAEWGKLGRMFHTGGRACLKGDEGLFGEVVSTGNEEEGVR